MSTYETCRPGSDCFTPQGLALEGVWRSDDGEVLAIKNHRFSWDDGDKRRLNGEMHATTRELLARPDDSDKVLRYSYEQVADELVTRDEKGIVRRFKRQSDKGKIAV